MVKANAKFEENIPWYRSQITCFRRCNLWVYESNISNRMVHVHGVGLMCLRINLRTRSKGTCGWTKTNHVAAGFRYRQGTMCIFACFNSFFLFFFFTWEPRQRLHYTVRSVEHLNMLCFILISKQFSALQITRAGSFFKFFKWISCAKSQLLTVYFRRGMEHRSSTSLFFRMSWHSYGGEAEKSI